MSDRIDDILRVLDNATQSSTEHGYAFQPPKELCWRCDCKVDVDSPTELCSRCIEEMRAEKPHAPKSFADQIFEAMLGALRAENLRFLAQAFRMGEPVLLVDGDGTIIGAFPDAAAHFEIPHGQCVMQAEDECSPTYCCERCPFRFVLLDDRGVPTGFDGPVLDEDGLPLRPQPPPNPSLEISLDPRGDWWHMRGEQA